MIQYIGAALLPCKPQQTARVLKFPHGFDARAFSLILLLNLVCLQTARRFTVKVT